LGGCCLASDWSKGRERDVPSESVYPRKAVGGALLLGGAAFLTGSLLHAVVPMEPIAILEFVLANRLLWAVSHALMPLGLIILFFGHTMVNQEAARAGRPVYALASTFGWGIQAASVLYLAIQDAIARPLMALTMPSAPPEIVTLMLWFHLSIEAAAVFTVVGGMLIGLLFHAAAFRGIHGRAYLATAGILGLLGLPLFFVGFSQILALVPYMMAVSLWSCALGFSILRGSTWRVAPPASPAT
jgi:hypothetical protein